jgi:hypothetical protein
VDGFEVAGGGIVAADNYPRRTADSLQKSHNIFWSQGKVTADQRAVRNGHRGRVLWLTGLSASGKSTIATDLERELFNLWASTSMCLTATTCAMGFAPIWVFRPRTARRTSGASAKRPNFSPRRVIICITAFISPYRSDRDMVRQIWSRENLWKCMSTRRCKSARNAIPRASTPRRAPTRSRISPASAPRALRTVAESVARIIEFLHEGDFGTEITI